MLGAVEWRERKYPFTGYLRSAADSPEKKAKNDAGRPSFVVAHDHMHSIPHSRVDATHILASVFTISAEHHVHFDQTTLKEEDFLSDNSCVTYQLVGDNIIDVHLGFLQHEHRYLIELHLPANLFKCLPNAVINLVADNNFAANAHCRLADRVTELHKHPEKPVDAENATPAPAKQKFFVIKVEYFVHKEHQTREELKMVNANNSVELLKLIVTARVLGRGKGTPMLRNGIHCIGYLGEPEAVQLASHANASTSHTK